jgi:hypothetical protein
MDSNPETIRWMLSYISHVNVRRREKNDIGSQSNDNGQFWSHLTTQKYTVLVSLHAGMWNVHRTYILEFFYKCSTWISFATWRMFLRQSGSVQILLRVLSSDCCKARHTSTLFGVGSTWAGVFLRPVTWSLIGQVWYHTNRGTWTTSADRFVRAAFIKGTGNIQEEILDVVTWCKCFISTAVEPMLQP